MSIPFLFLIIKLGYIKRILKELELFTKNEENTVFWHLVEEIRNVIGENKMLHVQTTAQKADAIVAEAKLLQKRLGGSFYMKVPIGEEGLKATMMLKELGISVTMTAIFTPAQALMAARAGASFVAPYVNRLDNIIGDGVQVVADIVKELSLHRLDTQVLAASFKNTEQVHKCALAGCHCVTVSEDIMRGLISHPMTNAAIETFERDWKAVYGNKTILDF